jgi:two-component system phosphate regulon sensor histidine kinase PhoR
LRTPLASIIGYVETLADPDARIDPATTAKFHATVLREAKRLQTLVEDSCRSRASRRKSTSSRASASTGQMAQTIASEVGFTVGDERILPETEPGVVCGDRQQLDQLIRNLIDNALKYGDADAPVTVRVRRERRDVVLEVADRGEGIHPDHLPYLTRRFYRSDPGRSRAAGGTGLGLAIVKHIVERHRGKLDIASTLGQGSTVTVHLPLVEPETTKQD